MTRQIRVSGRVQGVGFRDALREEAERMGITGWVRNRSDGTVEAVVQGDSAAVERILAWARRGPPAAMVSSLAIETPEAAFDRPYGAFERLPTL